MKTITLPKTFDMFIREKKVDNRSPKTLSAYSQSYTALKPFIHGDTFEGDAFVEALTEARLEVVEHNDQLEEDGKRFRNAASINVILRSFNSFLSFLYDNGYLSQPAKLKLLKEHNKVIEVYTDDELDRLKSFKPSKNTPAVKRAWIAALIVLDIGARIDEVLNLKKTDVDVDYDTIIVRKGKGDKGRNLPMSSALRPILHRFMRDDSPEQYEHVFVTSTGTKPQYHNVADDLAMIGEQLNFSTRLRYHKLRHTFGTLYIRYGGEVAKLMRIMGHTNISTTMKYVHNNVEDLKMDHNNFSAFAHVRRDRPEGAEVLTPEEVEERFGLGK